MFKSIRSISHLHRAILRPSLVVARHGALAAFVAAAPLSPARLKAPSSTQGGL